MKKSIERDKSIHSEKALKLRGEYLSSIHIERGKLLDSIPQNTNSNIIDSQSSKSYYHYIPYYNLNFYYMIQDFPNLGLSKDSMILDIGSGLSDFLRMSYDMGYTNVHGIDNVKEYNELLSNSRDGLKTYCLDILDDSETLRHLYSEADFIFSYVPISNYGKMDKALDIIYDNIKDGACTHIIPHSYKHVNDFDIVECYISGKINKIYPMTYYIKPKS